MKLREQRQLVRDICAGMAEALIRESETWPANWDGHELRDLIAEAAENNRSSLMKERDKTRRRRFLKDNASRFQSSEKRSDDQ